MSGDEVVMVKAASAPPNVCNQPDCIKFVCANHNISLKSMLSAKTLGELVGLCKETYSEGKARKEGLNPEMLGFDSSSNPRGGAATDHSSDLQILVVRRHRTLLLVEYQRRGLMPPLESLGPSGLVSL
ncbi:hypothetical protein CK203_047021 [Vitis vinifera]|uniref:Uncharacterized protein n=1 Tax=Vitis vinifera TaxID=29760 RepID=A0A438FWL4_VITVI|nr:hypothetical protein CK203_047021 [Vitis vinifera]